MQLEQDTIAAISTPPGRGGIGIVRLSGADAREIARPLLCLKNELEPGRVRVGHVLSLDGEVLDQCVATFFAGPNSYTGEDVLELACHGAPVLLDAILRACVARGARLAAPGEFTQRAFLNERLDLAQAEAVRDLIDSQTVEQARVAAAQLGGSLARTIAPGKTRLIGLIAGLEAGIDFAEDDLELMPAASIVAALKEIATPLERLASTFAYGRIVREGFTLALVGAPNAGKSSLFNALLERERAIVTAEAGTTRDTLSERLSLGGVPVTLVDTAGLRDTPGGEAEALGMARTREAMAEADLVIVVSCVGATLHREEGLQVEGALQVRSKCDLDHERGEGLRTSARTGEGIAELRAAILARLGVRSGEGAMVTNLRQFQALSEAAAALRTAEDAARKAVPHEMVLLDLYAALGSLDELTGATGSEEILGRIFSEFCIGK